MANARRLRTHGEELFRVSKEAFKLIRDNPIGRDEDRNRLLEDLGRVIDLIDPPVSDESLTTIQLTMTNPTVDLLISIFEQRSGPKDQEVLRMLTTGTRRTKQRAYVKLDIDHEILRHLRYVMLHTKTQYHDTTFRRLAAEIEKGVLEKNPMEILGKMAL